MAYSNAGLVSKALTVYAKDLRLELRSRHAINAILLFSITTLALVSFSLGQSGLSPRLLAALFWIVMFFSAMSGLSQVFVREEETGCAPTLRLKADPDSVYFGKLLFNFSLLSVMTIIIVPIFFVFTDAPVGNIISFLPVLVLGVIGLCAATTLVAAIIANVSVKGALFAVLSFPVLMPLLFGLVSASEKVLDGQPIAALSMELQLLLAYAVVMVTSS
ncbi:MAG: heme exporter protein CcmB, partial [candidate division Zixibacteria bacterium]|nr:heme exporter protein CcmB [candidate division Zixibacteria bacterium]